MSLWTFDEHRYQKSGRRWQAKTLQLEIASVSIWRISPEHVAAEVRCEGSFVYVLHNGLCKLHVQLRRIPKSRSFALHRMLYHSFQGMRDHHHCFQKTKASVSAADDSARAVWASRTLRDIVRERGSFEQNIWLACAPTKRSSQLSVLARRTACLHVTLSRQKVRYRSLFKLKA